MKNKKIFNNLFDSVCITLLLFVCLALYFLIIFFGVIKYKDGTNPVLLLMFSSLLFGSMIIVLIVLLIKYCYSYWVISDDFIFSKKMFSKTVVIEFSKIKKVEKKIVSAFVLGTYKSSAYIIHSETEKIVILISERKNFPKLDYALANFIKE